jgi:antitoxin HigA-1
MPDSEINYDDAPPAPGGPQPPAATLRKRMILRDLSKKALADALHVPISSLDPILSIRGGGMTAEMAARLARYFGDTPQFWIDLQTQYDLAHVDQEAIAREVLPAAS